MFLSQLMGLTVWFPDYDTYYMEIITLIGYPATSWLIGF